MSGEKVNGAALQYVDEYANWTDQVAQYPVTAEAHYLALGMSDEFGELVHKIYKQSEHPTEAHKRDVLLEMGDVLWYMARYSNNVLLVPFSHVWQQASVTESDGIMPSISSITVSLGAICGHEKKRIRDGSNWSEAQLESRNLAAQLVLIQALAGLFCIAANHRFALLTALAENRAKLSERLERKTIKGDGDHR